MSATLSVEPRLVWRRSAALMAVLSDVVHLIERQPRSEQPELEELAAACLDTCGQHATRLVCGAVQGLLIQPTPELVALRDVLRERAEGRAA